MKTNYTNLYEIMKSDTKGETKYNTNNNISTKTLETQTFIYSSYT